MQEIIDKVDIHSNNQKRFKLPERVIAKIFVFRLIYGGQAFSYANDPEFQGVSRSIDYWQEVIDEFYLKYKGMASWHDILVRTVLDTGQLIMPTGRVYEFNRRDVAVKPYNWRPKILNYPVQGTGADLVAIGRVTAYKRLIKAGIPVLWQSTVHDSLDVDVPKEACYNVCKILKESIEDIPINFKRLFKQTFDLPISCEIGFGPNLKELTQYNG